MFYKAELHIIIVNSCCRTKITAVRQDLCIIIIRKLVFLCDFKFTVQVYMYVLLDVVSMCFIII